MKYQTREKLFNTRNNFKNFDSNKSEKIRLRMMTKTFGLRFSQRLPASVNKTSDVQNWSLQKALIKIWNNLRL